MKRNIILQKFAKRIKDLRKINHISQEKLAEKADLSMHFVGCLERAEKNPTLTTLNKIAKAFNISLAELLTFPDDKKIADAKAQDINKLIEFLQDALEAAKRYKVGK